jgi:cytochrome c oxidase subunit 2
MPGPRRLAAALLCALPLALAACGGGGGDGGGRPAADATGEELYRAYSCSSCHSLEGGNGTGPSFKGIAGTTVQLEDGGSARRDRAYLERAIVEPDAQIVEGYNGGLMTASISGFDLPNRPEDVRKLVEFIQGVK